MTTTDLTAFCWFFPEMNLSRPLLPAAGRRTRISVPRMIPHLPGGSEMVNDLGELRSQMSGAMVQPRMVSSGCTSPNARVIVERSTPNQQTSTSWVTL